MENDDVRTEDLPDDLTPFITRTTLYPVSGGGFGDVWKCNYNRDANGISDLVAVKVFKLPERYDLETINRKISREIGILKILRHNNIVPLWGIATGFGRISELRCLVSPWMPNGTLNTYLASNHNVLTVLDRSRMLEDVSAGLRYLHSVPVMHGDITGANILIDKGGHARLIDFGLSTITQPLLGQSHLAATSIRPGAIRYAAPELVLSDDVRDLGSVEKTDIYSFGCVMLQILSGRPPWSEIKSERLELRIVVKITEGCRPQRPDGYPAIIDSDWNFIQKCLQVEPELRPSADEVLDFVLHRFHSPDSCSRPPDDPPDDAPDDFPGASPHDGSDDSDTTEQPPDSPPLHPDHELKTLTTVMEKLSASTSSTPTYNIPPNYSSGADHEGHSLKEIFLCKWDGPDGLPCRDLIFGHQISYHLREVHGIRGSDKSPVWCMWAGCNKQLNRESLSKHVEEIHLGIVYSCDCGNAYSRTDILERHRKTCTGRQ
ncbi:kinase-like domain-containing protein [Suillus placidus]|uniref:Kinase-like domain-containing protein n=1 Tax=Suillus placidus TaxID=48579 RepID=A0A9P7D6W2_9AGAM|nr:kinase-like domain-containing protein [Suillus placidus]